MDQNLKRVNANIGSAILGFYNLRMAKLSPEFHAEDLRNYISVVTGKTTAPGSADRILRLKRKKRELNYIVIDRKNSLYSFREVAYENSGNNSNASSNASVGSGRETVPTV